MCSNNQKAFLIFPTSDKLRQFSPRGMDNATGFRDQIIDTPTANFLSLTFLHIYEVNARHFLSEINNIQGTSLSYHYKNFE